MSQYQSATNVAREITDSAAAADKAAADMATAVFSSGPIGDPS